MYFRELIQSYPQIGPVKGVAVGGRPRTQVRRCLHGRTARRAVLFEAACQGHSNFQVARPRSSPITHSLGCASTRLTNALPARIRLSISIREYNVGFTVRCNRFVAGSRAANRSAYPTFSLITMRSISLFALSLPFPTEPNTNTTSICPPNDM